MMQGQIQAPKMKLLLDASNSIYQDLLGYKPENTRLQEIPENSWNEFAVQNGLNSNASGVYLPRNKTALIKEENSLSLFHEYFGHGLYCEQSLAGTKLVDLERRLLEEEKQEFKTRQFTLRDVQEYRHQNPIFQELDELRKKNLGVYEGFAIFTEFLLSGEFGLREDFYRKYNSLSNQDKKQIEDLASFNQQYGDLATFYSFGLARKTNPKRIKRLLENIYRDKIREVRFALLYGSRSDFSDIDVFIVSDTLPEIHSWLDVRVYNLKDFEKRLSLFDVAVTDPLVTGEILFGNRNYFEKTKKQLIAQPITTKAIKYNLEQSQMQKMLASNFSENSEENTRGLIYYLTYLKNALALESGRRLFTKKDLLSYSRRASAEDDKPLQLQGGRENAA